MFSFSWIQELLRNFFDSSSTKSSANPTITVSPTIIVHTPHNNSPLQPSSSHSTEKNHISKNLDNYSVGPHPSTSLESDDNAIDNKKLRNLSTDIIYHMSPDDEIELNVEGNKINMTDLRKSIKS